MSTAQHRELAIELDVRNTGDDVPPERESCWSENLGAASPIRT